MTKAKGHKILQSFKCNGFGQEPRKCGILGLHVWKQNKSEDNTKGVC